MFRFIRVFGICPDRLLVFSRCHAFRTCFSPHRSACELLLWRFLLGRLILMHMGQLAWDDRYHRSHGNFIKYLDNILRPHPDTAPTYRTSNRLLIRCSMNIDAPVPRIPVLRLQSIQPDNAGNNRIPSRRIHRQHFTGRVTMADNSARTQIFPDLVAHPQLSQRCFIAAKLIAGAKARGRYRIARNEFSVAHNRQTLVPNADQHFTSGR